MQQKKTDQIMVVVLNDMVQQSIPRIVAIQQKLELGAVLTSSEVDFLLAMLKRLGHCNRDYAHDTQCLAIFACIAHLLSEVVNLAHENERKTTNSAG